MSIRSAAEMSQLLLTAEEAERLDAPGSTDAAVLIPLYDDGDGLVAVFTERRADLKKHAGEISFPGGRQDEGETLQHCALREAREEIGLRPEDVQVLGALPPVGTFVTSYRVFPFVGLIEPGRTWTPQESEVAQVLEFSLDDLVRGHEMRRLLRKGVPIKLPTYTVDGHLVWGATGRIVEELLRRLAR
jgi:8-oxo-dGTP pyrophosphatase MutT (NUDIX family)